MLKTKKMSAWLLALCLGVPFLAACGGGGGGGGDGGGSGRPTATGTVSATDYEGVANGVVDTLTATNVSYSLVGAYSAHEVTQAGQPSQDAIVSLVRKGVAKLRAGERAQALAVESEVLACSSGGFLKVTLSYKDPEIASVGDYIDFEAQNCMEGDVRIEGGLRLTLTSVTQQSLAAQLSARSLAVSANTVTTVVNGVALVSVYESGTTEKVTVAYEGLSASRGAETIEWWHSVTYEHDSVTSSTSFSFGGFVQHAGHYFALRQNKPFSWSGDTLQGELDVVDSRGNFVRIVASADRFIYQYYEAGSSTPKATSTNGRQFAGIFY